LTLFRGDGPDAGRGTEHRLLQSAPGGFLFLVPPPPVKVMISGLGERRADGDDVRKNGLPDLLKGRDLQGAEGKK